MELWELDAREQIRDVIARYNANSDAARYDDVLALFAPDAVMELPDRTCRGLDEIRAMFADAAATFAGRAGFTHLRHFTATLQIDVLDETEARARCYYAVVMDHGLDHWGRYLDELRATDRRWQFSRRRVTVDGRTGPLPAPSAPSRQPP